jgi:hypothetical protein
MIRAEVSLLLRAAAEPDAGQRAALTERALAALHTRRCTWYRGEDAPYAELEDLYLDMEGVASWTAYQMAVRRRGSGESELDVLERFRNNRKWWSQEEGLALYLLLDRTVPDWRRRAFPPQLASAVALLAADAQQTADCRDESSRR